MDTTCVICLFVGRRSLFNQYTINVSST